MTLHYIQSEPWRWFFFFFFFFLSVQNMWHCIPNRLMRTIYSVQFDIYINIDPLSNNNNHLIELEKKDGVNEIMLAEIFFPSWTGMLGSVFRKYTMRPSQDRFLST